MTTENKIIILTILLFLLRSTLISAQVQCEITVLDFDREMKGGILNASISTIGASGNTDTDGKFILTLYNVVVGDTLRAVIEKEGYSRIDNVLIPIKGKKASDNAITAYLKEIPPDPQPQIYGYLHDLINVGMEDHEVILKLPNIPDKRIITDSTGKFEFILPQSEYRQVYQNQASIPGNLVVQKGRKLVQQIPFQLKSGEDLIKYIDVPLKRRFLVRVFPLIDTSEIVRFTKSHPIEWSEDPSGFWVYYSGAKNERFRFDLRTENYEAPTKKSFPIADLDIDDQYRYRLQENFLDELLYKEAFIPGMGRWNHLQYKDKSKMPIFFTETLLIDGAIATGIVFEIIAQHNWEEYNNLAPLQENAQRRETFQSRAERNEAIARPLWIPGLGLYTINFVYSIFRGKKKQNDRNATADLLPIQIIQDPMTQSIQYSWVLNF